jgi:hypothetical protein
VVVRVTGKNRIMIHGPKENETDPYRNAARAFVEAEATSPAAAEAAPAATSAETSPLMTGRAAPAAVLQSVIPQHPPEYVLERAR